MTERHALVTGGSGLIGRVLVARLIASGWKVVLAGRRRNGIDDALEFLPFDLESPASLGLAGRAPFDAVFHLAAAVHRMQPPPDSARWYYQVNTLATANLAGQAAAAGARRFVYVSTAKVHGEYSAADAPFTAASPLDPQGDYACSKRDGEQALFTIAADSGLQVVVIRPPLVYGPGVTANFARLAYLIRSGVPLPLASVVNRRSLIGAWNLADLLMLAADHPSAPGRSWMAADEPDVSTAELVQTMAAALGRRARLWPVPEPLLRGVARAAGLGGELQRLTGSFQVDARETRRMLGWHARVTLSEGMRRTLGIGHVE